MLDIERHPFLDARAFTTSFSADLGSIDVPAALREAQSDAFAAPVKRSEELRSAVRDLLRHGGYKPTGRGKPSSEYLVRAASEVGLPQINLAVDACNVVSLHSGFPISVIDLDRATPPLRIAIAGADQDYVFNPSGQTIDIKGLPCLFDAAGPCANAVKDSQRTKTHAQTRRTLSIVWGVRGFEDQLERTIAWYRALLDSAGARTSSTD